MNLPVPKDGEVHYRRITCDRFHIGRNTDRARNNITVMLSMNMDRKPDSGQGEKQYWESAAWIVFKDGKVLPSSRHAGNATRILLDLRASSG